jgi:peptide/nickel transport system substrate-binding protein
MTLSRRFAASLGRRLSRPPRAGAARAGSVLRVAPHADLKTLDPVAASIVITRMHGLMIYETLFAWDASSIRSRRWSKAFRPRTTS